MINTAEKNFAMKNALLLLPFCVFVALFIPVLCRENEPDPAFKYSKEANKIFDTPSLNQYQHNLFHHNNQQENLPGEDIATKQSDIAKIWLHAIGSTLLISAAPFIVLFIIPLDNSDAMKPRLKVILAFAAGGLLGDAFLHLIPHSTHLHGHEGHSHDHQSLHNHSEDMLVGLWVLGGIIAFLAVEKLVRLLKNGHGHSHLTNTLKNSSTVNKKHIQLSKKSDIQKDIEISGYLNLAADFAHNFTDGLAIGASYMTGNSIGLITTFTILLHEVPHEIGDFAILIKSGCSRRKAMMLQLFTAVGAIAGTMLALLSSSDEKLSPSWVLPFTAGGFIYIATVNVLPELLQESTKFIQSIKEILALLSGVGLMVCIASIE